MHIEIHRKEGIDLLKKDPQIIKVYDMGSIHLFKYIHGLSGLCFNLSTIHLKHSNLDMEQIYLHVIYFFDLEKNTFKIKVYAFKKDPTLHTTHKHFI